MMRRGLAIAAMLGMLAQPAWAQADAYPRIETEIDLGFYGVGTTAAPDPARRGTGLFLFGTIGLGLHLTPEVSVQGAIAFEPAGAGGATGGFPDGGTIGFRRQTAFVDSLFVTWRPAEPLQLYAGRFDAPFGRGHGDFPGILPRLRADAVYSIGDSLGFGGGVTVLSDARLGTHDLSAAIFTLDRSALSSSLITRRRCCDERYERFNRNTAAQGGPGNTGRLDNAALALDGAGLGWLPGFSYHVGVLSRGAGRDGTAREWGYAAAARYEHRWSDAQSTLLFAEAIRFRNAGGRPRAEFAGLGIDPDTGDVVETLETEVIAERRDFTTLGLRHRIGPWRGAVAWQRDQRKRGLLPLPTESFVEVSAGRDLGGGFGLDLGYQHARQARPEDGRLGTGHAVLVRLAWTGF